MGKGSTPLQWKGKKKDAVSQVPDGQIQQFVANKFHL